MRVRPTRRAHGPVAICRADPLAPTRPSLVLTLGRLSVLALPPLCLSFLFLTDAAATPFLCLPLAPLPPACIGAHLHLSGCPHGHRRRSLQRLASARVEHQCVSVQLGWRHVRHVQLAHCRRYLIDRTQSAPEPTRALAPVQPRGRDPPRERSLQYYPFLFFFSL
jgi:hypothetical protein